MWKGASQATASNAEGFGLDGGSIDVASDTGLTGMAIGSLSADASSTASMAFAKAGQGNNAVGTELESLTVGGVANITGAAHRYIGDCSQCGFGNPARLMLA